MEDEGEKREIKQEDKNEIENKLQELYAQAKELKKNLPKKARRQALPQSMSDEDFTKLISQLDQKKERHKEAKVAFLLAYESGLRISEIINLKKEDINLERKSIFVKEGKYSKDRVVPLPKSWKNYMIDYIPIKKGVRALQYTFKNAVRKAGLNPSYHFHCLRHSFATHCLERGMPINMVQVLMGHSSIGTTNVYVRANPADALKKYQEMF